MKLLHTSDWHIGRTLYGRKREEEFEAFLTWLANTITENDVDVLLVAGDIFDTTTPSNRAQALYYRFLCQVAASPCRHVVIIAGNHDSPSLLNAPKELLRVLDIHVVGSRTESAEDEIRVLKDAQGLPELIVCAVPYLRDRDIRLTEAGESMEDKERKQLEGIRTHYADVAALAEHKRNALGGHVPIVAMGHLFTAGGQTVDGDGVRELYVGSLAHVSAHIFPACFDYVALGHLHVPQEVNASPTLRYSGSPLPMGFGEATQQKSLCQVEFHGKKASVTVIRVPVFQKLERIKGDLASILSRIRALSKADEPIWIEVIYDDAERIGDLRERLEEAVLGSRLEILRIKNNQVSEHVLGQAHEEDTLDKLNPRQVFERCLALHNVPEDQRAELFSAYHETVLSLYEDDTQEK
jgi:DNA repair protein SbcD/Mre11